MRFSVVIPVYNVAPYLRACLDSVLAAVREVEKVGGISPDRRESRSERYAGCGQRKDNLIVEIICVDDGSTDGSGEILDEYVMGKGSDPLPITCRFRVIHQQNAGVSAARNAALEVATGEWVMMLDGDDQWAPDLLVRLFQKIAEHPDCDAVGFGMVKVDTAGKELGLFGGESVSAVVMGDEILGDRGPLAHFLWSSCDKIYRRALVEQMGLRYTIGMRTAEDSLFAHQFFTQATKVVLAPEIKGYRYLMHEGSAIHTLDEHLPAKPFQFYEKMYDIWLEHPAPGLTHRVRFIAASLPSLGKAENFAPQVRAEAIEFLLASTEFKRIVHFMLFHGTWKMRLFAMAMLSSPRAVKRLILSAMR